MAEAGPVGKPCSCCGGTGRQRARYYQRWSPAERRQLRELRAQGLTPSAIARQLQRSRLGVVRQLRKEGIRHDCLSPEFLEVCGREHTIAELASRFDICEATVGWRKRKARDRGYPVWYREPYRCKQERLSTEA